MVEGTGQPPPRGSPLLSGAASPMVTGTETHYRDKRRPERHVYGHKDSRREKLGHSSRSPRRTPLERPLDATQNRAHGKTTRPRATRRHRASTIPAPIPGADRVFL